MTKEERHHTPGPWIVQADPEFKGKHPYHDYRFVTTNYEFEDEPCKIICRTTDAVEQRENACLIAAAPDLLDACNRLLKLMPDLTRCVKNNAIDDYQELNEAPIAAALAIAKARTGVAF